MRLVGIADAFAGPATDHLLKENSGLNGSEEHQEFEVWNVHTGRQKVDGDDDSGIGPIAKLTDPLQRPVDSTRYLSDEVIASSEKFSCLINQLIGVRGMRLVVIGKDQGLWESAELLFMCVGVFLELGEDLAVRIWGGN